MKVLPPSLEPEFAFRVLRDAYLEATATYWRRRADQLEAARPRPGDYTGGASRMDVARRHERLTAAAQACRRRAELVDTSGVELAETLTSIGRGAAA